MLWAGQVFRTDCLSNQRGISRQYSKDLGLNKASDHTHRDGDTPKRRRYHLKVFDLKEVFPQGSHPRSTPRSEKSFALLPHLCWKSPWRQSVC